MSAECFSNRNNCFVAYSPWIFGSEVQQVNLWVSISVALIDWKPFLFDSIFVNFHSMGDLFLTWWHCICFLHCIVEDATTIPIYQYFSIICQRVVYWKLTIHFYTGGEKEVEPWVVQRGAQGTPRRAFGTSQDQERHQVWSQKTPITPLSPGSKSYLFSKMPNQNKPCSVRCFFPVKHQCGAHWMFFIKTEIIFLVDYLQNLKRNKIPVRSCFTELWFLKFFELFVRVPCQATQVNWVSETFAEKFGIWKGGIFDIGYFFANKSRTG